MEESVSNNRLTWKQYLPLLGILLLLVALRLAFIHDPLDRDEGFYAFIGQEILRGAIPYRDVMDIKPPGLFYLYSLIVSITGPSSEGIRVVTALYSAVTCMVIFATGRRFANLRSGFLAALFFAIYSGTPMLQGSGSNSEVFMLLPVAVAVYCLLRWLDGNRPLFLLLCGLSTGAAMLIKTVALPNVLLFGGLILWRGIADRDIRRLLRDLAMFILPIVLLYLLTILFFWANGALDELIYWNSTVFKLYVTAIMWEQLRVNIVYTGREHLLLWVAALPTIVWLLSSDRSSRSFLLAAALPIAFVGLTLPGRFYPHYFIQLIPALSLLAGIGVARCWDGGAVARWGSAAACVALTIYSAILVYPFYTQLTPDEISQYKFDTNFGTARRVAEYVRERTAPGDRILQWGFEPEIYFYSDRRSITPHIADAILWYSPDPQMAARRLEASLRMKRPPYVIVQIRFREVPLGTDEVMRVLSESYSLEKVIGEYHLYRLSR